MGQEPWSSGYGENSCSRGPGFESQRCILDGYFFTFICCKNCIVCLKRPKINEKEAGVGPFLRNNFLFFLLPDFACIMFRMKSSFINSHHLHFTFKHSISCAQIHSQLINSRVSNSSNRFVIEP